VLAQREVVDAALTLPIGQTAPQVALEAGRGLVALLGRLGEQLHDDPGHGGQDSLDPLGGRRRPAGHMAVDPLHGIGRGERQRAREHLIERDAERIEVAARIDRAVHPSGLLGRHIGQRAGDGLRRLEPLSLARKPRGDAEAGEPHFTVGAVDQDIGGLEVLLDEAAVVGLAQGRGHADGDAQKGAGLDGLAEQPSERLSPGVLEHQHGPTAFAQELERPRRPGAVQLVFQFILTGEAVEDRGRGSFPSRVHNQHGVLIAGGARARSSAEDAFPILPQDVETLIHWR